jgi:hypothetical protein
MSVTVRGKTKTWSFEFVSDEKYIKEWAEDGLEIDIVCNRIPVWAVNLGLTKVFCRIQDAWQFMRLW